MAGVWGRRCRSTGLLAMDCACIGLGFRFGSRVQAFDYAGLPRHEAGAGTSPPILPLFHTADSL